MQCKSVLSRAHRVPLTDDELQMVAFNVCARRSNCAVLQIMGTDQVNTYRQDCCSTKARIVHNKCWHRYILSIRNDKGQLEYVCSPGRFTLKHGFILLLLIVVAWFRKHLWDRLKTFYLHANRQRFIESSAFNIFHKMQP